MKVLIGIVVAGGLAGAALAQGMGSTYQSGSNLPQRTAGEIAPKTAGQIGGSGSPTSARKGQKKTGRTTGTKHKKGAQAH